MSSPPHTYTPSFEGAFNNSHRSGANSNFNNMHHNTQQDNNGERYVVGTGFNNNTVNTPSLSSTHSRGSRGSSLKIIVEGDMHHEPPQSPSSPNNIINNMNNRHPPQVRHPSYHLPPITTPLSSHSRTHSHNSMRGGGTPALPPISFAGALLQPLTNNSIVEVPPSVSSALLPPGTPTWASSDLEDSGIASLHLQSGSGRIPRRGLKSPAGAGLESGGGSMPNAPSRGSINSSSHAQPVSLFSNSIADGPPTGKGAETISKKAEAAKKKVQPSCCTVPIAFCFVVACIVITVVLAVTTAFPIVLFNVEVTDGIKTTLAAGLEGTMMQISDTLGESYAAANQFKAMIESNPGKYACDDGDVTFPGNTSNIGFLYEAGMYAMQRVVIRFIYQTRESKRHFNPDGTPIPISCLVDPYAGRLYLFANKSVSTADYFGSADQLNNISSLVATVPSANDITNVTIGSDPLKGTGPRWLPAVLPPGFLIGTTVPTKFSIFQSITDPSDPTAKWSIGIDHNMINVQSILLQGTPPVDLIGTPTQYDHAHTTMYDLANSLLMASTHVDMPVLQPNGKLWSSGLSPIEEVNDAYNQAVVKCHNKRCIRAVVDIDDGNIRTSYNVVNSASNLHLLVVSVVPRHHFFAESDRVLTMTIAVAACCCVALVVSCILLLVLMYRPLASLELNMMMAAELHNDRVEHTPSYLREIANLSSVFDGMNQQLLIARSFVPEAVLLGKTEDSQEADDDVDDDEGSVHAGSATEKSNNTGNSETDPGSTINGTNATNTTTSSGGMAKLFNITEKRVAVLSLNLLGFHALCAPDRQISRAQRISDVSTALLTMAVASAHEERGVMDSFHGDHFVLTFNASRAVAGPLAAAVRTGNAFIRRVRSDPQFGGCSVAAGAASGKAQVGTLGIDGYRRMSVVGDAYRKATALQLAAVQFLRMNARRAGLRDGCMVDESSLKELGSSAFYLQVVGCIQSALHRTSFQNVVDKPPMIAYFALDAKVQGTQFDDEWLYELDAIEATDPYHEPNRAMMALVKGNLDECSELINTRATTTLSNRISSSYSLRDGDDSLTSPLDVDPMSPMWSTASGMQRNHPQRQPSENSGGGGGNSPAWNVVLWHYKVYVAELERLGTAKDPVALCAHRIRLPWVVFQQ